MVREENNGGWSSGATQMHRSDNGFVHIARSVGDKWYVALLPQVTQSFLSSTPLVGCNSDRLLLVAVKKNNVKVAAAHLHVIL